MLNTRHPSINPRPPVWIQWVIAGHITLVLIQSFWQFFDLDSSTETVLQGFYLATEMNYAVWWSGICLFAASLLFYRNAIDAGAQRTYQLAWLFPSILSLCLCADEISSFHEKVNKEWGFLGLLPFAIVLAGPVVWAIDRLGKDTATRKSARMLASALCCFALVGLLELVEHNFKLHGSVLKPLRGIFEEGLELAGITFLLLGGLAGYTTDKSAPGITDIGGPWEQLKIFGRLSIVFLIVHVLLFYATKRLDFWHFRAGNPVALYPTIFFFLVAVRCFYFAQLANAEQTATSSAETVSVGLMWKLLGILFVLTSLFQFRNPLDYVADFHSIKNMVLVRDQLSWYVIQLPMLLLMVQSLRTRKSSFWKVLVALVLLNLVSVTSIDRSPFDSYYFLYSGLVAFICVRMVLKEAPDLLPGQT